MKRFSWIITLPLLAIAVIFSVSNRQAITFDLWPLDLAVSVPAFLPILVALFVGVMAGGLIAWWTGGRTRARARDLQRDLEHARMENARLKREQEKRRSEANMEARALTAPPSARPAKLPARGEAARSSEL